jgi:hypothetical protein
MTWSAHHGDMMLVSLHTGSVVAYRLDIRFDGDALAGMPIVEVDAAMKFAVLHPAHRAYSLTGTGTDPNVTVPKQTLLTLNSALLWFKEQHDMKKRA